MIRYSHIKGMLVRKPKGEWVQCQEAEQQIKKLEGKIKEAYNDGFGDTKYDFDLGNYLED